MAYPYEGTVGFFYLLLLLLLLLPPPPVLAHNTDESWLPSNRLGLSLLILTRQQLLSVLYNGLRNKSNIQLRKKVVEIRPLESGISVLTDDGDVYHGDLVAGADGVHSLTRSELWRIASKEGQEKTTLKDQSGMVLFLFIPSSTYNFIIY